MSLTREESADISVLVVEKNLNPFEEEAAQHDFRDVAFFLEDWGFNVDLVWTLSKYKFTSFNKFYESIMRKLKAELKKDSARKDELREIFERVASNKIKEFEELHGILRKTPINSVEDLKSYDFMILHPNFDEREAILPKIAEKYPFKPKIFPLDSGCEFRGGIRSLTRQDFLIEGIYKDAEYEAYCLDEYGFKYNVLKLIEHISEARKKSQ